MRRTTRGGSIAALLTAGAIALTGCASGGESVPEATNQTVTIVAAAEPSGVEPCNAENGGAVLLRYNVIQSLTTMADESREIIPLLATAWEQVDPTTWVFTLREGVTFHDGADFNAEAAVFGINRAINNEAIACSNTAKIGAGIKVTPTATGPYEVTLTTSVPDPILPLEISYIDLVSPNTPADVETDQPIGTGPYVWDSWDRGQSITLTRFDDYWGEKPTIETAKLIFRQEASQRLNVITAGEADIALSISADDAPDGDRTVSYGLDSVFGYRLPFSKAPFNDLRVREALRVAIDKETITTTLLGQTGQPWDQLVADSNIGFVPGYKAPSFNADKAKSLLAEAKAAGVAVDTPVDLVGLAGQFPGSDEVEQAVLQNLQQAGFNVTLRIVDADEWKKLLFKPFPPEQTPTILAFKHDNQSGDPSSSFTSYVATSGCCGAAEDPTFDSMFAEALSATGDERATLFQKAAEHEYTKDVTIVPVASLNGLIVLSDRVDFQPTALTGRIAFKLEDITIK